MARRDDETERLKLGRDIVFIALWPDERREAVHLCTACFLSERDNFLDYG